MLVLDVAPFRDRSNFGMFLTSKGLTGTAVEIGTHRGEFAKSLLDNWAGRLFCIDPWTNGYDPMDPASSSNRQIDLHETHLRLGTWIDIRCTLCPTTSAEAVYKFADESLDFVYVDGCHQPEEVYRDINIWYPKIRSGGILAGHDFMCINESEGGWGRYIQEVVLEFSRRVSQVVYLVIETDNQPWSWYIMKS